MELCANVFAVYFWRLRLYCGFLWEVYRSMCWGWWNWKGRLSLCFYRLWYGIHATHTTQCRIDTKIGKADHANGYPSDTYQISWLCQNFDEELDETKFLLSNSNSTWTYPAGYNNCLTITSSWGLSKLSGSKFLFEITLWKVIYHGAILEFMVIMSWQLLGTIFVKASCCEWR